MLGRWCSPFVADILYHDMRGEIGRTVGGWQACFAGLSSLKWPAGVCGDDGHCARNPRC
jgi:hypothetical protein